MTVTAPIGHACRRRRLRAPRPVDLAGCGPEPESVELCMALLEEAIARAERWCLRRERALADFDVRAAEMVRCLRNAGVLASSAIWAVG